MSEQFALLIRRSRADKAARERLWTLVIDEIRRLARMRLRNENNHGTLETDALVNELFLKLDGASLDVNDRAHFLALAARQLRCILIDHARARKCAKRGGDARPITLRSAHKGPTALNVEVLDLHAALEQLEQRDRRTAEVLELHYFGGLRFADIANALGISVPTVTRKMRLGKAWLRSSLNP